MIAPERYRLRRSFLLLLVLVGICNLSAGDPAIQWRTDYNAARKEALEKGKPLFLDFGTEECYHCRRLDQLTLRDARVIQMLNENFIPLKINANREPALTQALKIQAYPTLIFAGTEGKILGVVEGFQDAPKLLEHLTRAASTSAPDWMARDYQESVKAINTAEYARAVTLLRSIIEDGKDRPIQEKSKQLLYDLEQQALTRLTRVKTLHDRGQSLEAIDLLTDLLKRYPGTVAANDGSKWLTILAERPEVRALQTNRRAEELLVLAKEDFKSNRFLACLDNCEVILSTYKDSPSAKEASQLMSEVKDNPERMTKVCTAMNDRMAQMYLTLAETLEKKGKAEEAIACLEKLIKIAPGGTQAEAAQVRIAKIQSNNPNQPVKFSKP
jgi:thioredoxin-related protein